MAPDRVRSLLEVCECRGAGSSRRADSIEKCPKVFVVSECDAGGYIDENTQARRHLTKTTESLKP